MMKKFFRIALFTWLLVSGIIGGGITVIRLESYDEEYQKIKIYN